MSVTIESEPTANSADFDPICRLWAIGRALAISMQASAYGRRLRGNVYLLKIGAKSFGDGIQDICKDTKSNLGPFCWLLRMSVPRGHVKF